MSIIELTEEQRMIRDVARDFAQDEIKPVAAVYPQGFPVTATQKVKIAELKEITDKTWDGSKMRVKFSVRK